MRGVGSPKHKMTSCVTRTQTGARVNRLTTPICGFPCRAPPFRDAEGFCKRLYIQQFEHAQPAGTRSKWESKSGQAASLPYSVRMNTLDAAPPAVMT